MKPMLSLDLMLGGGAGRAATAQRRSAADDLQHRLLQIVWANGEGLGTATPTRGTALLQHGFKEWAAARGVSQVLPGRALPAVRQCEADNWMPLVLCRGIEEPLQLLQQLLADGPCAQLALGSPAGLRLAPGRAGLQAAPFPLPLPAGADASHCLWLGAPDMLARLPLQVHGGLRIASSELQALAMAQHLAAAELRLHAWAPASLWCLLFLDDVMLGDTPATAPPGVPPEALATTLRWLQRQLPTVCVCMVSQEPVTPARRGPIAELARHLGGALYRHAGVRREAFAPPGVQKNL